MSADCLMRSLSAVPMPWPALELVRRRIGFSDLFASSRRADHFARVIRRDASIVCAGHHQNGRIFRSVDHMMIRRVSVKRLELLRVFHGAELGHVKRAVWRQLHSQHIVNAHLTKRPPASNQDAA